MRFLTLWFLIICSSLSAQLPTYTLDYYLPEGQTFDPAIPTPKQVLGFEVGEWHVTHDQQIRYMERLAAVSDRISIDTIGYTHERRPLLHLHITAASRLDQLEDLRSQHLAWADPELATSQAVAEVPLVVWMGYSIHGDEASGGNAALLMAYYLAAAQGPTIDSILNQTVVILDPCYNPDGFQRYSTWVNMHRGTKRLGEHSAHREHNEVWPTGRTNHYWFDLNRDWLPVQHPESQARIAQFHRWKPNFLTDHHEMGTNSTFFFQPGIPSRNNPLTPKRVFDLTEKVGRYHAKFLDEIGSLYFSQESFDDFYYGKGSTYPDINGAVGILFEQASVEGQAQRSTNGVITFPFAVRNHFRTSLSTLHGTHALRGELLAHQQLFFEEALAPQPKDAPIGYVIKAPEDRQRFKKFQALLERHQIRLLTLPKTISIDNQEFTSGKDLFIPSAQKQRRLIQAMFDPVTEFQDSLFYDVSTWTLPMAFDLTYAQVPANAFALNKAGETFTMQPFKPQRMDEAETPYAYLIPPYSSNIPAFLNSCFDEKVRIKVAKEPFVSSGISYPRGTYLIPTQNQALSASALAGLLRRQSQRLQIPITGAPTGLTQGVNLGSNSFRTLEAPKVLLLVGNGVTSYEAGEVWHLLDTRYEMEVTMTEADRLGRTDLDDFNTIIMVNGSYRSLQAADKVEAWLKKGGRIIAYKGALNWIAGQSWTRLSFEEAKKDTADFARSYAEQANINGAQVIGGAICKAYIDRSHPLGFGFEQDTIHLFRNSTRFMALTDKPFTSPVRYTDQPLASGYISPSNLDALRQTAAVNVFSVGSGKIIAMTDNPNFRAFWFGTNRLFANALFLGGII